MRLTLHKKKGAVLFYWQAWTEGSRLWIQQGEVGGRGARDRIPFKAERPLQEVLDAASREPRADGFAEWLPREHPSLQILPAEALSDEAREGLRAALEDSGNLLPASTALPFAVVDAEHARRTAEQSLRGQDDLDIELRPPESPAPEAEA